jgi:hypothetical protein
MGGMCNYGGQRAWFVCPGGCGRRAAILYYGNTPACRHCYHLAYESQQESASIDHCTGLRRFACSWAVPQA